MGIVKKILIGTGITAAVAGAVTYLSRLNKTSQELVVVPSAMIHKISLQGIMLRVDVKLKNPTRTKLNIKFPFIKMIYKDSVVGSSKAIDKDILIPANGEAAASEIMIEIPIMGLFSIAGDLLKALDSGKGVQMGVRTLTTIDLGWKKVPYETTQQITLKKQNAG